MYMKFYNHKPILYGLLIIALFVLLIFNGAITIAKSADDSNQQAGWRSPSWADTLKNPLLNNVTATAEGKKIYAKMCAICHDDKGKGNGVAGMNLNPKPANLVSKKVQEQTDGAIYWKITTGRPPMASYNQALTETQRWQLVNYIRKLVKHQ